MGWREIYLRQLGFQPGRQSIQQGASGSKRSSPSRRRAAFKASRAISGKCQLATTDINNPPPPRSRVARFLDGLAFPVFNYRAHPELVAVTSAGSVPGRGRHAAERGAGIQIPLRLSLDRIASLICDPRQLCQRSSPPSHGRAKTVAHPAGAGKSPPGSTAISQKGAPGGCHAGT